jgi:NAD-dependent oxidoreductase involved in siderophore biosynthesis
VFCLLGAYSKAGMDECMRPAPLIFAKTYAQIQRTHAPTHARSQANTHAPTHARMHARALPHVHTYAHDACGAAQAIMEEFAASEKIQVQLHLQRDRAKVYKGLGRKVASAWKV